MGILRHIFTILAVMVCLAANAQHPAYRQFSIDDGLAGSTVYRAFQDSKGFIWFATETGVSKFDGYKFENFNIEKGLPDNEILKIFEDSYGRIWFLSFNGKISFYKNNKIHTAITDSFLNKVNTNYFFTYIYEDSRHCVWIGTCSEKLIKINPDNTVDIFKLKLKFNNRIFFIGEDDEKNILVLTWTGLTKLDMSTDPVKMTKYMPLQKDLKPTDVFKDGQDILIIDKSSLYKLSVKNKTITLISQIDTVSNNLDYIAKKDSQHYWISSEKGVLLAKRQKDSIIIINHFFPDIRVTSVLKDHEGNYWFTTYQKGVYFVPNLYIQSYNNEEGLIVPEVTSIGVDKTGTVWFGQNKGYYGFIKKGQLQISSMKELPNISRKWINDIYTGPDYLWMCADYGLIRIKDPEHILYYQSDLVKSFCINPLSKNYYFNVGKILVQLSPKIMRDLEHNLHEMTPTQIQQFIESHKLLNGQRIYSLHCANDGTLWFGSNDGLYKKTKNKIEKVPIMKPGEIARITDIKETKDSILCLATHGYGLIFFHKGKVIGRLMERDGLASNFCRQLFIDNEDNLWVATINGLVKIRILGSQIYEVQRFNIYDGLLSNEVNDVVVRGDSIWVATSLGINQLDRKYLESFIKAPPVNITSISTSDSNINVNGPDTIQISYKSNNIKLNFIGLSYRSEKSISYRYKIIGFADTQWNYTSNTSIEFQSLAPGQYTFVVQAQNKSGIWSSHPASVTFNIKAPFWKKSWFSLVAGFMIIFVMALIFYLILRSLEKRNRLQHKLRESEQKALRAQINPHLISNALNSIQKFFFANDFEKANGYLSDFGILMRKALEASSKSYITLAEEVSNIKLYLSLESMRLKEKFQYQVDVAPDIDIYNTKIPSLLIQPFVENAIWHGIAPLKNIQGFILITFVRQDDGLLCTIDDNGIGIKQSASNKHNKEHEVSGIKISSERLELLNWKKKHKINMQIIDKKLLDDKESGTRILLFIPL